MVSIEDELSTDWERVESRRYQDDIGRCLNFHNLSLSQLFNHLNVPPMDGEYPYIKSWEETINTRRSGAGGSRTGDEDEEGDEE